MKLAAQTTDILPRQKPSDSKQMQIRRLNLIQNTESTTIKATTRAGEPAQREQSNAPLKNCRWAATREAGKLPGPSCTSERACKPQLLLHQSRPRYTMLDWHPSAQITQARLEPRVTASALEMWHCGACCHASRAGARHELQSVCTRRCQAPGPGRRDVQCLVQINCRPRQSVLSL